MSEQKTLVIPRWFYPDNLGDSLHTYFVPRVLKMAYPNSSLQVVTHGELVPFMSTNPYVDLVREPEPSEMGSYDYWKGFAASKNKPLEDVECLFAEWHPRLWEFWNEHFDLLSEHPTANILTINSLLQLGLEEMALDGTDLFTHYEGGLIPTTPAQPKTLCIVPATKLAGRPTPHPGCDGKGLRFNGDNGESWKAFVERIRELDPTIEIISMGGPELDFVDHNLGKMGWESLATICSLPAVAVMSDGGLHHMFNLVNTPVVLLDAQKINKPCFFKLQNAKVYDELNEACSSRCAENIRNLKGWDDLSRSCDYSCEKVDPVALADKVYRDFF